MESRGVATPEVSGQDASGGDELEPDERIGDIGEIYSAKTFVGEVLIGDIEANRGS